MAAIASGIEAAAREVAAYHVANEPNITAIHWFPSDNEIRLIELDNTAYANQAITPFYFGMDQAAGIAYPLAVALIRPSEKNLFAPPEGWGDWSQSVVLYP